MKKNIQVETDDPQKQQLQLTISGTVEKFASIQPARLMLTGTAGQPLKASVSIVPEKNYPFKIIRVSAKKGDFIKVSPAGGDTQADGAGYKIEVENLKADAGRYYDSIEIRTDSKIRPKLTVPVYGNIREDKSAKPAS